MPDHPEAVLESLGLELPPAPAPVAVYVPAVLSGNLVFVSGQIPVAGGTPIETGIVGEGVSVERAAECAQVCALNALAVVKAQIGDLAKVRRVVRIGCFVACGAGFTEHPKVANGASELMGKVFGDRGQHARAAVGCPSLPLGVPVEVEFCFEVE